MTDNLPLSLRDGVLRTKQLSEHLNMYSSLHIKRMPSGNLWLCERNYTAIEVDWTNHFQITKEEALDIIASDLAKPWMDLKI